MLLLYAIGVGLAAGLLLGGRMDALGGFRLRWVPLALAGFAIQLVLFSGPVSDRVGDAGPPIYVASTVAVLVAVVRNVRLAGFPFVVAGALANLAAITANGGYMPASPDAVAMAGRVAGAGYSNGAILPTPVLAPLTDVFAAPSWLPMANVFSLGDMLIALGFVIVIVTAMRSTRPGARRQLTHPDAAGGTGTP